MILNLSWSSYVGHTQSTWSVILNQSYRLASNVVKCLIFVTKTQKIIDHLKQCTIFKNISIYSWSVNSVDVGKTDNNNDSAKSKFKSSAIFDQIETTLKTEGESLVNKVKGVFAFKVKVSKL